MLEAKLISIIIIFLSIIFSIIGFYYIFDNIVKNIKRNKDIKTRERMIESGEYKTTEIIPPSLFRIKINIISILQLI